MATNTLLHLVGFELESELFAIPIETVQEIINIPNIVKIPKSPSFIEGVINLRGKVIPIIDLNKRFEFGKGLKDSKSKRIIVANISRTTVGLIVDKVHEVIRVEDKYFERTSSIMTGLSQEFIKGLVKHNEKMLIILELDKILSSQESKEIKEIK